MVKIVVTTGRRFTDIDALACVFAYMEIPPEGALGVIPGPLNQSIPQSVRAWLPDYPKTLKKGDYEYIIVDVSEAPQLPEFVDLARIKEIFDHHFGFETYWEEKLGPEHVHIEAVGACATQIWEEFRKQNPSKKISPLAANLLYTAILSNTLDFKSSLTTNRDKKAFEELAPFTDLPPNWTARYYLDQEADIYRNPIKTLSSDTKIQIIKGISCAIGQMELWNSRDFIKEHQSTIEATLKNFETETWMLVSPCISEARTYIFTRNKTLQDLLSQTMAIDFFGTDVGVTKKLWLRKEILKKIQ